ncbi:hypothetical protein [Legionella antarctica]|uniref:hypothetical protein n=1 Tax=Legionella antarctica TaxID=2708020 RepID=UPI0015672842|nr:hypothetical protein [Legionella antarctica]
MLHVKSRFSKLAVILLSLLISTSIQAGLSVVISAPPLAREKIVAPPGYTHCYLVQPGFYNGVWHHKHRVCEYNGTSSQRIWVNGYWQCGSYRTGGICTRWHWIGSHWANRLDRGIYRRAIPGQGTQVHVQEQKHQYEHGHGKRHRHNEHGRAYEQSQRYEHGHSHR